MNLSSYFLLNSIIDNIHNRFSSLYSTMNNNSFTFPVNATHIGYSIVGKGEPLLICPVSWGIDGHRWKSLDVLSKYFTLIKIDPRGTGMSGEVNEKNEYGIPILVEDIEQIRIHL